MQPSQVSQCKLWRTVCGWHCACCLRAATSTAIMNATDKISPPPVMRYVPQLSMQTVDPWPEYVLDTDLDMDGELAVKRANDYKAGNTKPLEGQRSSGGSIQPPRANDLRRL